MKRWYEELFDNYGEQYDKESYTQEITGKCDFIEKELDIEFLKHDARNLSFDNLFDVAVMLCEGGIPAMETDDMMVRWKDEKTKRF